MLDLYSGTPGSGKSLHLARTIKTYLTVRKKPVICNFPINTDLLSKNGKNKIGEFTFMPNEMLTVDYLVSYSINNKLYEKEGSALIVIDEAGIMFNSRDYAASDRKQWLWFMSMHRHFGYNIILASQQDRMLDRQIRGFIESDYKHRKANNFKFIGFLFTLFRIPLFVVIEYWYPVKLKNSVELFIYHKKDGQLYSTMGMITSGKFGDILKSARAAGVETDLIPYQEIEPPADTDGVGVASPGSLTAAGADGESHPSEVGG